MMDHLVADGDIRDIDCRFDKTARLHWYTDKALICQEMGFRMT